MHNFKEYCKRNQFNYFRPILIYEIRWVDSHLTASTMVYKNYEGLCGHLHYVYTTTEETFDDVTKEKAERLYKILTNKYFVQTLALQLDIQSSFSIMSKEFQTRGNNRQVTNHSSKNEYFLNR